MNELPMMNRPKRCVGTRSSYSDSGFALVAVVWTVAIVSLISIELVASMGSEARLARNRLESLQAARLAAGGHEVAEYLRMSGRLVSGEVELDGLPISTVVPGRSYRVTFPNGTADVDFESENGKYSLSTASEDALARVFALWRGDSVLGERMARAVVDWRDPDALTRGGAPETRDYGGRGYTPRNQTIGIGDAHLIAGFTPEDFQPRMTSDGETAQIFPGGLYSIVTALPTGERIHPNYAPALVLGSLSGMTPEGADRIRELREEQPFRNRDDFAARMGIASDAPILDAFVFDDGLAPAVQVAARVEAGPEQYERRVYQTVTQYRPETGLLESYRLLRTRQFHPLAPDSIRIR